MRRISLSVLALLVCAAVAHAQIFVPQGFFQSATAPAPAIALSQVSANTNTSTAASFSWSTQAFGAADASRKIALCVAVGSSTASLSSPTIGGINATTLLTVHGGSNSVFLIVANVPTGTSGTIAFNTTSTASGATFIAYRILNALSSTPTDTGNASSTGTSWSDTLTINPSGAGIACGYNQHGGSPTSTLTWTNLTEDTSVTYSVGTSTRVRFSGASSSASGSATRTLTANQTSGGTLGMAAFR